jgi:hypothetical protein
METVILNFATWNHRHGRASEHMPQNQLRKVDIFGRWLALATGSVALLGQVIQLIEAVRRLIASR